MSIKGNNMNTQFAEVDAIPESLVDIRLAEAALAIAKDRMRWNACKGFYAPVCNALQVIGSLFLFEQLSHPWIELAFAIRTIEEIFKD